ncbi:hypothetical protein Tco_1318083 [Tanacetum coccineum]
MSRSTISYESLAQSVADSLGSSVSSAALPYVAPVVDSESDPFEDPKLPVASDADSVEPSVDSELFVDHVSPAISAASDPDGDQPLGSSNTADYYGGYEFFEHNPSEDVFIDVASDTIEPSIQLLPAFYPHTSPIFPAPVIPPGQEPQLRTPFRTFSLGTHTVQTSRKSVRPQSILLPSTLALIAEWNVASAPLSPPPSPRSPLSSTRRDSILEADLPPPAARQPESVVAQGAIDRLVVALEEIDERVADLGTRYRQDSHEMYVRIQDAHDDIAVLRARLASVEQEAVYTRKALGFTIDEIRVLQRKRQESDDRLTRKCRQRNSMSAAAIKRLISQCVTDALLTYEENQNSGNINGNGNINDNRNGNDNGNGNDNMNGSHDSGSGNRRTVHTARGCTYKEFLNCQPLNFKGTEGAIGLAHWFENMESVFVEYVIYLNT